MAFVLANRAITIQVRDSGNNETTRTFHMSAASDAAQATDAAIVLAAFDAVTDAKISSYTISQKYVENAFTLPVDVELENQMLVTLPIAGKPNKSGTVKIPAPPVALFNATSGEGRNQPNFLNSTLLAFLTLMTQPATIYLSDGEQASGGNYKGRRVHSKSNRG